MLQGVVQAREYGPLRRRGGLSEDEDAMRELEGYQFS